MEKKTLRILFIILPITFGMVSIAIYLRHFFYTWKEIRFMLVMQATTLEEAQGLWQAIETKISGDTILERRLKQHLS